MRSGLCLLVALAAAILSGCTVPSVSRLYATDKSDVTSLPGLIGIWTEDEGERTYTVTQGQNKEYQVAVAWKDPAKRLSGLEVNLVRVGDSMFADISPASADRQELSERYGASVLAVHAIARIALEGDELKVWQTDNEVLAQRLKAKPDLTPHAAFEEETVILTGSPAQVKSFITAVAHDDELFKNLVTLKRPAAPPAK